MESIEQRQFFEVETLDVVENYEDRLKKEVLEYLKRGYCLSGLNIDPYNYYQYTLIFTKTSKKYFGPSVVVKEIEVDDDSYYDTILAFKMLEMQKAGYDLIAFSYVPKCISDGIDKDRLITVFLYND